MGLKTGILGLGLRIRPSGWDFGPEYRIWVLRMSFGPRGFDLAQFNIICFLPVIMTKKTGKPRGRPRKTEDVDDGRKKKRERDQCHYQRN